MQAVNPPADIGTALIVTPFAPLGGNVSTFGAHIRLRLFVDAIASIARKIELVHLVTDEIIEANRDLDRLNAQQSTYWGRPVSCHLIACRRRSETFVKHYLSGISSAFEQSPFNTCAGPDQAEAIGQFLDRMPDLVFVQQLTAMLPVLRSGRRPARMFFDLDDIEHRLPIQAVLRPPFSHRKVFYLTHVPARAVAEWRGSVRSRLTFVCSRVDRSRLTRLGFRRVAVVPNALPVPPKSPDLPTSATVLFLGACRYQPNIEAAERLVRRIFPRIRALIPGATLQLAGIGSLDLPSRREHPEGVEYLGFVEDLRTLYASARVICCPITSGSGTRLKLIEAAGYARPIVATRFAVEGLDFRDNVEIVLQDEDEQIAGACVRLLRDEATCRALGTAARSRMQERYDEATVRDVVARLMLSGGETA